MHKHTILGLLVVLAVVLVACGAVGEPPPDGGEVAPPQVELPEVEPPEIEPPAPEPPPAEAPPAEAPPPTETGGLSDQAVQIIILLLCGLLLLVGLIFLVSLLRRPSKPAAPAQPSVPPKPPLSTAVANATTPAAVNVYSGPGANYPVYGATHEGATFEITGASQDGEWFQIKVPASIDASEHAWVMAKSVNAQNAASVPVVQAPPPPPPARVETPTASAGEPTATAKETIHVRGGPGNSYPDYGVAHPGDKAKILGVSEDGQWYVVQVPTSMNPNGYGWVSAFYVTAENADDLRVIPNP